MTGCVSYFAATLTDTLGPAPFQDPQVSFFTSSLGLCFEGRVDSSLLYIYIWDLKSMSVLKAVISNFQWVKKRPIERPPQGETLGASDTFNIQEKRYWFLGLNE